MPDSERIVKQLEADLNRAERTGEMMVCVGRKTAAAAITLLKERVAVVRCRDCVKRGFDDCPVNGWMPNKADGDWFCADSVAKDINVPDKEGR